MAEPPIALAEVQGYAYAAYVARGAPRRRLGATRPRGAGRTRRATAEGAFNETFWLPDRGWFALGLDRDKRPIDSLASNMGHCLWTGIVDEDKARPRSPSTCCRRRCSAAGASARWPRSMAAYNPMSYHYGSVWPHDNAIVRRRPDRYGFVEARPTVAGGCWTRPRTSAADCRSCSADSTAQEFPAPVPYPTSCSPQAWAAAAPLLMLRSLLRLDPEAGGGVWCAPAMPARFLPLRIADVEVQGRTLTVDLEADRWDVVGHGGLAISRTPRPVSELTTTAGRTPQGGSD